MRVKAAFCDVSVSMCECGELSESWPWIEAVSSDACLCVWIVVWRASFVLRFGVVYVSGAVLCRFTVYVYTSALCANPS